ncbi:hypothetical protein ACHAPJ_007085 [Fusarium lateritium]
MSFKLTPQPDNGRSFTAKVHNDSYEAINPINSNLDGRAVFITGASRGIGRAIAISYALAGASFIAVTGRCAPLSLVDEIQERCRAQSRQEPKIILPISLEVTDLSSVEAAANEIKAKFGKLDILVSNAGFLAPFTPILESDPETWWKGWEVHVKGFYNCIRATLPLILNSGEDSLKTVVNITSSGAHQIHIGAGSYEGSKLGAERLCEFVMAEYGEQGLLCFNFHPGSIRTELSLGLPEELHAVLSDTAELGSDTLVFLTQKRREWLAARYISARWDITELLSREAEIAGGDQLRVRLSLDTKK